MTDEVKETVKNTMPNIEDSDDAVKELRRAHRKRIGQQFKEARLTAGLSIRDVEERCGVSRNIICRTEGGRANTGIDGIAAIAAAVGKSVEIV